MLTRRGFFRVFIPQRPGQMALSGHVFERYCWREYAVKLRDTPMSGERAAPAVFVERESALGWAVDAANSLAAGEVLAIDGRSGSGKTSFAAELAVRSGLPVLPIEAWYPGWEGLAAGVSHARRAVRLWKSGETAQIRTWDWERMRPGRIAIFPADSPYVLEGVGASLTGAQRVLWCACPGKVRQQRALQRDPYFADFWSLWEEQEEQLFGFPQAGIPAQVQIIWRQGPYQQP